MQLPTRNTPAVDDDWGSENSSDCSSPRSDAPKNGRNASDFTEFAKTIDQAIAELGGEVMPKLTWSAPLDSVWVTMNNSIRCCNAHEIFLLLKCSDRVSYDLSEALTQCTPPDAVDRHGPLHNPPLGSNRLEARPAKDFEGHVLALRRWYDLKPGREFRCFVVLGRLRAISQRNLTMRCIGLDEEANGVQERIETFHEQVIARARYAIGKDDTYSYDCYVPSANGATVRLIDFNPPGPEGTTSALLFDWNELKAAGIGDTTVQVEFRFIREDIPLRPETALYGVPHDFVDSGQGSALNTLLEKTKGEHDLWASFHQRIDNP